MNLIRRLLFAAASLAFAHDAIAAQCAPPDVSTYCTAGTTVHGCVPLIRGVGLPSAVDTSGFDIVVSNVPGQRAGLIDYGFAPVAVPWSPASLSYRCVSLPQQRTPVAGSGGAAGQCNGELRLDFNAWRFAHPNALGTPFVPGQVLYAQGWFRDPGAPKQTNLSDGLRFVLAPPQWPTPAGMVVVPAGTFLMGSSAPNGPPYFGEFDDPVLQQVTITYCYWIAQMEVTQAQYSALMGSNPSSFPGASHPVENVSWSDALAYCDALTAQESALGNVPPGYEYRLPTEAEWEYACRAGSTDEFNIGPALFCNQANFDYSYHSSTSCGSSGTAPVASFVPNAWGLYDMHGNVWEWCLDGYVGYSGGAVTDPYVSGGSSRVVRGGGWRTTSVGCRSAYRGQVSPIYSSFDYGFRVILGPVLFP